MMSAAFLALTISQTPYLPNWDSLASRPTPKWFRDAKFGIWAHWGPQAVPMFGDWYARNMYIEGNGQYKHHLEKYGHPSEHGFREIIEQWKAEKWDPDSLMKLYKESGAKYFVSMGVHHDNFDLWNSKYHGWNATKIGPKRDVVGEWQKAAKKYGLKFGVSEHLGASFTWWQTNKGADKEGPNAGKPYDGIDPKYAELYHPKAEKGDAEWYSNNPKWHKEWYARINDLVTNYKPDLLYSDGGVPFGQYGRQIIADLYNSNKQAVYNAKDIGSGDYVEGAYILDRERGGSATTLKTPWQTDTSIGDWFYNVNWGYRKPDWVIHTLVDIVSKNGNLLLNVVQRPDGSLDPEVYGLLKDVGDWLKVNGEAIYGTRPWLTFGEGPTKVAGGHFREDFPFTAKDIRYTMKGKSTIYATTLGLPTGKTITLRCLALLPEAKAKVKSVSLLGFSEPLPFKQDSNGLTISMPSKLDAKFGVSFKIACTNAEGFRPDLVAPVEEPPIPIARYGGSVLTAGQAATTGKIQVETRGGQQNLGFWDSASDSVSWKVHFDADLNLELSCDIASPADESELVLEIAAKVKEPICHLVFRARKTGNWDVFANVPIGTVTVPEGEFIVSLKPANAGAWKPVNVRGISMMVR